MSEDTRAIEESIKIALDAADAATNVTAEFETIRKQNEASAREVKKVYRYAIAVFASSMIGAVAVVVLAALMYYRTLSEMQTTNQTSLEALVIFAENVDKLVGAIGSVEGLDEAQAEIAGAIGQSTEAMARIEAALAAQPQSIATALTGTEPASPGPLGLMSGELGSALAAGFAEQAETLGRVVAALESVAPPAVPAEGAAEAGAAAEPPVDRSAAALTEIMAKLDAVTLLSQEISAKITAVANRPAPAAAPAAPRPRAPAASSGSQGGGDIIKFP
jgi:hypothetical protein